MNTNFMVKVQDAKLADLKKALDAAGITVRSIQEVYKEDTPAPTQPEEQPQPTEQTQ